MIPSECTRTAISTPFVRFVPRPWLSFTGGSEAARSLKVPPVFTLAVSSKGIMTEARYKVGLLLIGIMPSPARLPSMFVTLTFKPVRWHLAWTY